MESTDVMHEDRCINSALWAAYGDALGFPTELASQSLVAQRVGSSRIFHTLPWRRLVGGRFGAEVELPAGAYSDDTQLRLATCRAIRSNGHFDVESFAKVELPVWLSYCLGAGRGSKAAARSLGSKNTNWFSNFFNVDGNSYINGGGNGAAMRIQPHVWVSGNLKDRNSYLPDVIRNAVCSHGDIRGIGGAAVHAVNLSDVLIKDTIPTPEDWIGYAQVFESIPALVAADSDLSVFWRPTWEKLTGQTLEKVSAEAANEWTKAVTKAVELLEKDRCKSYRSIVTELNGLNETERGSGLKTVLFAMIAAWLFQDNSIEDALVEIVNVLESDTDSIASMTGALLGARKNQPTPTNPIQDKDYIIQSTRRIAAIPKGLTKENFSYPDLLYWYPPKSALDSVGKKGDQTVLTGIGFLTPLELSYNGKGKGTTWHWFKLNFGQTVLCKHREPLRETPEELCPVLQSTSKTGAAPSSIKSATSTELRGKSRSQVMQDLFDSIPTEEKKYEKNKQQDLDELTDLAIRSSFDPKLIGEHLLALSESERAIEDAIAYSVIIAKAWRARVKKRVG